MKCTCTETIYNNILWIHYYSLDANFRGFSWIQVNHKFKSQMFNELQIDLSCYMQIWQDKEITHPLKGKFFAIHELLPTKINESKVI